MLDANHRDDVGSIDTLERIYDDAVCAGGALSARAADEERLDRPLELLARITTHTPLPGDRRRRARGRRRRSGGLLGSRGAPPCRAGDPPRAPRPGTLARPKSVSPLRRGAAVVAITAQRRGGRFARC